MDISIDNNTVYYVKNGKGNSTSNIDAMVLAQEVIELKAELKSKGDELIHLSSTLSVVDSKIQTILNTYGGKR